MPSNKERTLIDTISFFDPHELQRLQDMQQELQVELAKIREKLSTHEKLTAERASTLLGI